MADRIQLRRDTATNWSTINPILAQGELGIETDTGKIKIGDGVSLWSALSYFTGGGSSTSTQQQATFPYLGDEDVPDGDAWTLGAGNPSTLTSNNTFTGTNAFNNNVAVGASASTVVSLRNTLNITGASTAYGITSEGQIQSGVTTTANYFHSAVSTQATSFVLAILNHYNATQGTIGAGSAVTTQFGFRADSSLTGATNNYGFYSQLAIGNSRYNFYASGTADNAFAGRLVVGFTSRTPVLTPTINNPFSFYSSNGAITDGITAASGTVTHGTFNTFENPSITAVNTGVTYINASTVYIDGAPTASTNVTITNPWALYVNAGNNYMAGSLGLGSTSLTGYGLRNALNITGATNAYGIVSEGQIQSGVTNSAQLFRTVASTAAAAFTLSSLSHYIANQGTIGAGSAVTNQFGFVADSSLTGATNNYGFWSNIASGANRYNFYAAGTADNYMAGALGIGSTTLTQYGLRVSKNITGASSSFGVMSDGVIATDVTGTASYFRTNASTTASLFTLTSLYHFYAQLASIGATSTVTNQLGFVADASLIGATNNYGFYGQIASGTGRWNIYATGTADNYMAGSLGIGTTTLAGVNLIVLKNITGATSAYGIGSYGTVQSDVTVATAGFATALSTAAAAFTLPIMAGYLASQGTIGAGSTVTAQYGFRAAATLTGATNNYGFYGELAIGSGRYNFYAAGTADNQFNGKLTVGAAARTTDALSTSNPFTFYSGNGSYTDSTTAASGTVVHGPLASFRSIGLSATNTGVTYTNASTLYIEGAPTNGVNLTITNPWALYVSTGNVYLGSGALSLGGGTVSTQRNFAASRNINGSIGYNIISDGQILSTTTSLAVYYYTQANTQASAFTLTDLVHYYANQGTFGAGSTVTNQYGFAVENNLTGATNNYGFYSRIASGTGRYNFYASGTADNYMAGSLGIGSTSLTGYSLHVSKNITGGANSYGIVSDGVVQSDVTTTASYFFTNPTTQATTFTLSNLHHYSVSVLTFGAGSTVTNQRAFYVPAITGATNNYGFWSELASGTGRYNFYAAGTADNFMAGELTVGGTARTVISAPGVTNPLSFYSSNAALTDGVTAASGTVTHGPINAFDNPSIAATNTAVTYTNASTVYIDGAPTASTNVTITNPYALYVASGASLFGGAVSASSLSLTTALPLGSGGTGQTTAPAAQAALYGFTTTATAGGTTTLTNTSSVYQVFTGTLAQTITLPSTATLAQGWFFHIVNNSTGTLTVQTSTAVSLGTVPPGVTVMTSCLDTTVNTAAAWEYGYTDFATLTGTGNNVLSTSPTVSYLSLAAGTSTAGQAPLKFTSGTNLATAEAGAKEYDGANYYATIDTTSGRAMVPAEQYFRLTAAGTGITATVTGTNYFGANSNINLVGSGEYEIEVVAWFAKTTATTVIWNLIFNVAPTTYDLEYSMSPITGIVAPPGTATLLSGHSYNQTGATASITTGSLTTGANHFARFKLWVRCAATTTSMKINVYNGAAGTITPGIGSYWKCRRLPAANVGTFAA